MYMYDNLEIDLFWCENYLPTQNLDRIDCSLVGMQSCSVFKLD